MRVSKCNKNLDLNCTGFLINAIKQRGKETNLAEKHVSVPQLLVLDDTFNPPPAQRAPTFHLIIQNRGGYVPPQRSVRVLHHLLLRLALPASFALRRLIAISPQLAVLRLQLLDLLAHLQDDVRQAARAVDDAAGALPVPRLPEDREKKLLLLLLLLMRLQHAAARRV